MNEASKEDRSLAHALPWSSSAVWSQPADFCGWSAHSKTTSTRRSYDAYDGL